jgi:hypothetical protein
MLYEWSEARRQIAEMNANHREFDRSNSATSCGDRVLR